MGTQALLIRAGVAGPRRQFNRLTVVVASFLALTSQAFASGGSGTSVPSGPKAVKIVFREGAQGSFNSPPPNGTAAIPGSGLRAVRVYNADGSLLASGGSGTPSWPKWLSSVELGISGANNSSATGPDCARFSAPGEDTAASCSWSGNLLGPFEPCGGPPGLFRVSEYDCSTGTPASTGNGGPNDGIYVRIQFSRNTAYLGSTENIMAVIEYSASAIKPSPTSPTTCFTGGVFNPSAPGCADQVWQLYMKHDATELAQPFLMMIPPAFGRTTQAQNTSGTGIVSKQFILPLATDQNLTVMQLSRISGRTTDTDFTNTCNPDGGAANSAHCVGVVIYSITLFRI